MSISESAAAAAASDPAPESAADSPTSAVGYASLFVDATTFLTASRSVGCALNPRYSLLSGDVLDHALRPLLCVPHLVVSSIGEYDEDVYALPLDATQPQRWCALPGIAGWRSVLVARSDVRELLLVGGQNHNCSRLSLRRNDPAWQEAPQLPDVNERGDLCAVLLSSGKCVVAAGGIDADQKVVTSTVVLQVGVDTDAGDADADSEWLECAKMPTARSDAGCAAIMGDRMLVVGGRNNTGAELDSTKVYDSQVDRWLSQEARLSQPMWCRAASIAGHDRVSPAVLAVQSNNDGAAASRAELLDCRERASTWMPVAPPPVSLYLPPCKPSASTRWR